MYDIISIKFLLNSENYSFCFCMLSSDIVVAIRKQCFTFMITGLCNKQINYVTICCGICSYRQTICLLLSICFHKLFNKSPQLHSIVCTYQQIYVGKLLKKEQRWDNGIGIKRIKFICFCVYHFHHIMYSTCYIVFHYHQLR